MSLTCAAPRTAITVGAGVRQPQGRRLPLDGAGPLAVRLAEALRGLPPTVESWWAPGTFDCAYRVGDRWCGSMVVGVDADYQDRAGAHAPVPAAVAAKVEQAARAGALPGNVYHPTPRGLRIVLALDREERDAETWQRAARGACELVARWLADAGLAAVDGRDGYEIDTAASCDRARLLYAPRAVVGGVARDAEVIVLREQPFAVEELAALAPPTPPPVRRLAPARPSEQGIEDLDAPAVERAIDLIAEHLPAKGRHDLALALAGMLWVRGADVEDARYLIYEGYRRGGSDDPRTRAAVVDHTWALPDDAPRRGYTFAAGLIGEEAAGEIADALDQVYPEYQAARRAEAEREAEEMVAAFEASIPRRIDPPTLRPKWAWSRSERQRADPNVRNAPPRVRDK